MSVSAIYLVQWQKNRGEEEVEAYRRENNQVSLDNRPTGLYERWVMSLGKGD